MLLVPSSPLNPRRPDEHFARDAAAARDLGVPVALVDHDALVAGDAASALPRSLPPSGRAVYRGWMVRSEAYALLEAALAPRGVSLLTSATGYRTAHELPGWYAALDGLTPVSSWTGLDVLAGLDAARSALGPGPAVLRDFSKSLKHAWSEACFVPDLSDARGVRRVAQRFLDLRGNDLVGGLVLRRFEEFVGPEVRSWWVHGRCVLLSAHPDTPLALPGGVDVSGLSPAVSSLGLPFVTVDVVSRSDGALRVVELGDGQVSDLPSGLDPALVLGPLLT